MSIRFNLSGNVRQPKTKKNTLEELVKDMPNLKESEATSQARMNSIIEGMKYFAAENFKFNSGNSVFTDAANLKNDETFK